MYNSDIFVTFRKELHQFPEVSGKEFETKKRVLKFMKQFNPDDITEIGKTGLIFTFKGEQDGKSIMVRAELDALPIQEVNAFNYASVHQKVSHKCGHDGHMAILTHLADQLNKKRPKKGDVHLLFQPAEENGEGAKEVTQDRKYEKFKPDAVVALHNIPGYPLHEIIVIDGEFTPAVNSIIVKWNGKTSHAAEPENGINPGGAMADFMNAALNEAQVNQDQDDFFLVTPVFQTMGEKAYGVSAGYGETHLTLRTQKNDLLKKKSEMLENLAQKIGKKYGINVTVDWTQEFNAINNDDEINQLVVEAAKENKLSVTKRPYSMKWGEDFGLFTELHPGALFGLGSGESTPSLHNPDYDFPDELIETGSKMFETMIRNFLK